MSSVRKATRRPFAAWQQWAPAAPRARSEAVEQGPAWREARSAERSSEAQIRVRQASYLPSITLTASLGKFDDKFRQLEVDLPTPNTYRTASGAPGEAYWQQQADYVITMGCGDKCPFYPGKQYLDWPLEDQAGKGDDAVRPIRDAVRAKVEALIAEIGRASCRERVSSPV